MDSGNRTEGYSTTQETHHPNLDQHHQQQPNVHRKGRDSVVEASNPHHDQHHPTTTTAHHGADTGTQQEESGFRRVINKLNPLHRSPSPSPDRRPGFSDNNPNVPGQDTRTVGEKARDAIDPRRHPKEERHDHDKSATAGATGLGQHHPGGVTDNRGTQDRKPGFSDNNPNIPGQDTRTVGEKARDALDPRRHPKEERQHHDTAAAGGSTGIGGTGVGHHPGGGVTDSHRTQDRPPGFSDNNPNVPGQDTRTVGEKARDAVDPRRHPKDNTGDTRTLGEKARDTVDPRRHTADQSQQHQHLPGQNRPGNLGSHDLDGGAHHHRSQEVGDEHNNHHKRDAALGMAGTAGAGTAAYRHHEHDRDRPDERQHGDNDFSRRDYEPKSSDHHFSSTTGGHGYDDRSTLEKVKDKADPRVKDDRREAHVLSGNTPQHHNRGDVGGIEHSLRETRLGNDNPSHLKDDQSVPFAADSTHHNTLGQQRSQGDSHQFGGNTSSGLGDKSSAAGGLHIGNRPDEHHSSQYRPDVGGENYQPGYSIPPAEKKEGQFGTQDHQRQQQFGDQQFGDQQREREGHPVHSTGFRSEGGDFDASRPGAASEGRRLKEQTEQIGSSLDPSMR